MLSTEFKHGPLSAVDEGYPVIFVAGPEDVGLAVSGINEVAVRGGHTIAIAAADCTLQTGARTPPSRCPTPIPVHAAAGDAAPARAAGVLSGRPLGL